ncbi:unnamed protein product [Urochloa humidicola]
MTSHPLQKLNSIVLQTIFCSPSNRQTTGLNVDFSSGAKEIPATQTSLPVNWDSSASCNTAMHDADLLSQLGTSKNLDPKFDVSPEF